MRQMSAAISRGGHTCTANVLIQKDAPLDMLLGTDLQAQLGFLFLQKKTDGTAVDLLQKREWIITQADDGAREDHATPCPSEDGEMKPDNPSQAAVTTTEPVVHLIQATRLPSRHVKFVRARVLDPHATGIAMFEAEKEALKERGLVIEDTVVEPDGDRCVTLAAHNCSLHTVRLEEGHILGSLQAATVLPTPTSNEQLPEEIGTVKVVQPAPLHEEDRSTSSGTDSDRMTRLLERLHWDSPVLTPEQKHRSGQGTCAAEWRSFCIRLLGAWCN